MPTIIISCLSPQPNRVHKFPSKPARDLRPRMASISRLSTVAIIRGLVESTLINSPAEQIRISAPDPLEREPLNWTDCEPREQAGVPFPRDRSIAFKRARALLLRLSGRISVTLVLVNQPGDARPLFLGPSASVSLCFSSCPPPPLTTPGRSFRKQKRSRPTSRCPKAPGERTNVRIRTGELTRIQSRDVT